MLEAAQRVASLGRFAVSVSLYPVLPTPNTTDCKIHLITAFVLEARNGTHTKCEYGLENASGFKMLKWDHSVS